MHNKMLHLVAFVLMALGGLNWLLVGVAGMDIVMQLLGSSNLANAVYILIGLATVYEIISHRGRCADCKQPGHSM